MQAFLEDPYSEISVPKAINCYMLNPSWQVERGCMLKKKQSQAAGNEIRMLRLWNGDISGAKHYAESVLSRRDRLLVIYG